MVVLLANFEGFERWTNRATDLGRQTGKEGGRENFDVWGIKEEEKQKQMKKMKNMKKKK